MRRKLATIGLLAGLFFQAPQAWAFTLNYDTGNNRNVLGWNTTHLAFDYDLSACPAAVSVATITSALQAALDLWNGVPSTHLTLALGSSVSMTAVAALALTSGNPVIVCDTNFSTDIGTDGDLVVGIAQTLNVDSGWHTSAAALVLNAESGKQGSIENHLDILSIIVAHEIGHILGLGHSTDVNALMYYDATAKRELALGQDDVDGVTYLYPRNEPSNGKAFGCASLAIVGASNGGRNGRGGGGPGAPTASAPMAEFALLLLFCLFAARRLRVY